ncbi:MAG: hypothetical protein HWD60_02125 [Defluviicoccus sp.]|nr:MAG: hypothetical protein HWD60_02125 [Defluviicoccus sp.]
MPERAIYYGTTQILSDVAHRRIRRSEQSIAARHLLDVVARKAETSGAAGFQHSSLAHSRTICACAIGIGVRVGIDIEWMSPGRNGRRILELLCGLQLSAVSTTEFYRAWTFSEAYFKATGNTADKSMLHHVIQNPSDDIVHVHLDGNGNMLSFVQMNIFYDFMLSIIWITQDAEVDIRVVSDRYES